VFGEYRHWCRRNVERAERAPQGLDCCDDLPVLPITPALEIAECDHLNKVVERHCLLAAQLGELPIEFTPERHELFAQAFLLVVASRFEINAIPGAGDTHNAVLAAAWAADESSEGGARPFAFSF